MPGHWLAVLPRLLRGHHLAAEARQNLLFSLD